MRFDVAHHRRVIPVRSAGSLLSVACRRNPMRSRNFMLASSLRAYKNYLEMWSVAKPDLMRRKTERVNEVNDRLDEMRNHKGFPPSGP